MKKKSKLSWDNLSAKTRAMGCVLLLFIQLKCVKISKMNQREGKGETGRKEEVSCSGRSQATRKKMYENIVQPVPECYNNIVRKIDDSRKDNGSDMPLTVFYIDYKYQSPKRKILI